MVIDINKPIEAVANWDETIVYPATFRKRVGKGFHISIDKPHFIFKSCAGRPARHSFLPRRWTTRGDGTFGDLTLRNVQEPVTGYKGYRVHKRGGDYEFDGEVVSVITKKSGAVRYVVEDDRGLLLIMNESQVRPKGH